MLVVERRIGLFLLSNLSTCFLANVPLEKPKDADHSRLVKIALEFVFHACLVPISLMLMFFLSWLCLLSALHVTGRPIIVPAVASALVVSSLSKKVAKFFFFFLF